MLSSPQIEKQWLINNSNSYIMINRDAFISLTIFGPLLTIAFTLQVVAD